MAYDRDDDSARFTCDACGVENVTSGETCEACGAGSPEPVGTKFELSLLFAAEECPICGETVPGGICANCGADVPAPEPSAATKARTSALVPLGERARSVVASFDAFPDPHIAVSPSQLAFAISDAELPTHTLDLIAFARNVSELELEDPYAIGSETRRRLAAKLDDVERLRDLARLLAEFEAAEPVAKLPTLVARMSKVGAMVIEKVLGVLVSETPEAAGAAAKELQDALEAPAEADEIERLLALVPELFAADDVNARVALVTGRDADYTDDLGLPDPVLIFAPAPGERTSFAALSQGARRYLSHLLADPDKLGDEHAILVFPAVQLALLDRPCEHHRRAELVGILFRDAGERDPAALDATHRAYEDHAGMAFETSMRVRRLLRLLATGEVLTPADYVESAVEMYRQLAEGHFRAAMRCVLAARAALEGKDPPPESILLGDIESRLGGWHDELGRSFDGVIERHLRNGEAHQEYRVDPATLEVVLQDGLRLTPDDIEKLTEDLAGAVVAIDAAANCHTINTGRTTAPSWLANGESPRLVEQTARTVAAGLGVTIDTFVIENGTVTIRLPDDENIGRYKARQVLWTARPFAPSATEFKAYRCDRLIASFTSEGIDRWQVASDAEQPLLMIEALYESEVRCGAGEQDTLRDAIATCARFTINEPLSMPPKRAEIRMLENRLRAISRMASRHDAGVNGELSEPLGQIRSARESLKLASRSQDYGRRFGVSISALARWADQYPGTLIDSVE
jgi:hypothetical protein